MRRSTIKIEDCHRAACVIIERLNMPYDAYIDVSDHYLSQILKQNYAHLLNWEVDKLRRWKPVRHWWMRLMYGVDLSFINNTSSERKKQLLREGRVIRAYASHVDQETKYKFPPYEAVEGYFAASEGVEEMISDIQGVTLYI